MKEAESYTMTVGELNALLAEKQNKMPKNKPRYVSTIRSQCVVNLRSLISISTNHLLSAIYM